MHDHAARRNVRQLAEAETIEFIKNGYWGVMALAQQDEPYGVPIIYGYDAQDGSFYIANGPGRKIEMALANPRCTLTVVEVDEYGKRWRSVIVRGRLELVEDMSAKLHAFNILRKQMPRGSTPSVRDAARLAKAKVIRVVPDEIPGRAIGS